MKAVSDRLIGSWRPPAAVGRRSRGSQRGRAGERRHRHAHAYLGEMLRVPQAPQVPTVPMVLLTVLVVLSGCSDLRVISGVYANLDEVQKAGARDWVPQGLPSGTSGLRQGHRADGRQLRALA